MKITYDQVRFTQINVLLDVYDVTVIYALDTEGQIWKKSAEAEWKMIVPPKRPKEEENDEDVRA